MLSLSFGVFTVLFAVVSARVVFPVSIKISLRQELCILSQYATYCIWSLPELDLPVLRAVSLPFGLSEMLVKHALTMSLYTPPDLTPALLADLLRLLACLREVRCSETMPLLADHERICEKHGS